MQKSTRRVAKPAQPRITRVDRDLELVAPRGCHASVLLTLVNRDARHRYYTWLAVIGNDNDRVTVSYKHGGKETIRMDLPDGMPLSGQVLEPFLASFLGTSDIAGPPPIIIED